MISNLTPGLRTVINYSVLPGMIVGFMLCLASAMATAAIDTYEFADAATRDRFHGLTAELRCPKCQNQNLADSNAPIAEDLRAEVYRLLKEGKSDREIKDYLVDRYGEYVLYKPEFSQQTWLLWGAPVILLVLALVIVLSIARRRMRGASQTAPEQLNDQEQSRIKSLLEQDKDR